MQGAGWSPLHRVASVAVTAALIALGVWGLLASNYGLAALMLGGAFIGGVVLVWLLQPGTLLYEAGGYLGQRLIHGTRYEIPTAAVREMKLGSVQFGEVAIPCIVFEGADGRVLMRHLNVRYAASDLEQLARRAGVDLSE